MSSSAAARGRTGRSALVVLQLVVFVTYLFGPTAAFANDPSPEPTAAESAASEPTPDPEPAPSTAPEPSDEPVQEEPSSDPASSDAPSTEPTAPAEDPAATAEAPAAPADEPAVPTPWIGSDRDDYAPGSRVIITSGDWQPGESVRLVVNDDEGSTWQRNVTLTADDEGFFLDEFLLPAWFVATYTVTATGETSGPVTFQFADSVGAGAPGTAVNASGSTVSMTAPAVDVGDVLVAQIVVTDNIATTHMCLPSAGGWVTDITGGPDRLVVRDGQNKVMVQAFYKVATAAQAATVYSWDFKSNATSCGGTSNARSEGASGAIVKFSGVDTANPIDDVNRTSPTSGDATAPFAAVTTTTDGAGVLRLLGVFKNNPTGTTLPATNKLFHANGSTGGERAATMWGTTQATAGGSPAFTATFNSGEFATITLALRAAVPTTLPTTVSGVSGSGTYGSAATLTATLNSGATGLAGKLVAFMVGGDAVGSATTNASGIATLAGVSLGGYDAGTYPNEVAASFAGDAGYTGSNGSGTLTVAKANATIEVDGFSGTYDGDPHGATGTATGVNDEDLSSGLNLGASFTNVPGGTASWTFDGGANYNDATGSVAIVINKANAIIDVDGFQGIYDGDPHGASGTASGVKGEDLSGLLNLGASYTDVPGGTANWTFAGNGNYHADSGSVQIEIGKATVTGSFSVFDKTYDGTTAAEISARNVHGVVPGDVVQLVGGTATFDNPNAGLRTVTGIDFAISGADAGNYQLESSSLSTTATIGQADATIVVNGFTGTYDGDPHGATGTASGVGGVDLSAGLSLGASFTNVPGGTANWTFEGGVNYQDANGTAAIVITKANATIDVDGTTTTYDGDPHGASGTATGVKGEDLSGLLDLGATFTNVPGGTAEWTFAGNGNYHADAGSVEIVIGQKNVTGSFTAANKFWDGTTAATVTSTSVLGTIGLDDVDLTGGTATFANAAVGTWTVTLTGASLTGADAGNYILTSVSDTSASILAVYRIEGFYRPVDMTPVGSATKLWNTIKGGSTVPLKFRVYSAETGAEITSTAGITVRVAKINCTSGVLTTEDIAPATGSTSLRYDALEQQFVFNWATPKGANICYEAYVLTADGETQMAGPGGTPLHDAFFRSK